MKKYLTNLKELYVNYKEHYEWNPEPNPPKYNYFKFIWELFTDWVKRKRCKYFGHQWNYDCDISPDSGSESMECTCCGLYYNHTHY